MEGSVNELSLYRYSKAQEDLKASEVMLSANMYKASINRSYYAIFHGIRAVNALDKFDSSKHSGVIAYFNQNYVKTERFEKEASRIVKGASLLREKSDYQDFYIASKTEAREQFDRAKTFLDMVGNYLKEKEIIL